MGNDYFSEHVVARQVLVWTVAARQELERWESDLAEVLRLELYQKARPPGRLIWDAEIAQHFMFVAARNLIRALDLDTSALKSDGPLRDVVIQVRDLLEHWDENLPIFNVSPRRRQPSHRSGREYAQRNPDSTPYSKLRWSEAAGPKLGPDVPASDLRRLLDEAEEYAVTRFPSLAEYVPEKTISPWFGEEAGAYRWWPKR